MCKISATPSDRRPRQEEGVRLELALKMALTSLKQKGSGTGFTLSTLASLLAAVGISKCQHELPPWKVPAK